MKIYPYMEKKDQDEEKEDEGKIHSISISNFLIRNEPQNDPELLEFCRCICCFCLLFTKYPEIFCKWLIKFL